MNINWIINKLNYCKKNVNIQKNSKTNKNKILINDNSLKMIT